ncbi:hypothetical protein ACFQAT_01115 [Undibacterium arcticum]|uniref:Uncharacterized protein n=1 Tax=Undibacterium arcticum TaxID=1762892 RepID=A0ABV7EY19_9BURK
MRPRFAPAGLLKAAGNNPSSAAVLRALENMGRKDLGGVVVNYSKNKKRIEESADITIIGRGGALIK